MKLVNETLGCDSDDCKNFIIVPPLTPKDFRRMTKDIGWTRKDGKDHCPNCSHPELVEVAQTK